MRPRTARAVWTRTQRARANDVLAFAREHSVVHPRDVDAHFVHGKVTNRLGGSSIAVGLRQLGTPSEARKLLAALDPARDLAWMSDDAKLLYWREPTTDDHALGDYGSEIASAVRLTRKARAPLAAAYIRARALAGMTGGWMYAPELASPAWVLHQIATQPAAHGAPVSAPRQ